MDAAAGEEEALQEGEDVVDVEGGVDEEEDVGVEVEEVKVEAKAEVREVVVGEEGAQMLKTATVVIICSFSFTQSSSVTGRYCA